MPASDRPGWLRASIETESVMVGSGVAGAITSGVAAAGIAN